MTKIAIIAASLLLGACASPVTRIEPVSATENISRLCIKENKKVFSEDFLPEVRSQIYFTRSRIELFQKAESVTLATHQEQTYVLYGCCSGNLQ